MKNIYVDLYTMEKDLIADKYKENITKLLTNEDVRNEKGELAEINEFFLEEKICLLIHGLAGSGKSTMARKIEEFIWNKD